MDLYQLDGDHRSRRMEQIKKIRESGKVGSLGGGGGSIVHICVKSRSHRWNGECGWMPVYVYADRPGRGRDTEYSGSITLLLHFKVTDPSCVGCMPPVNREFSRPNTQKYAADTIHQDMCSRVKSR